MSFECTVSAFDREVGVLSREEKVRNAFVNRHGEEEMVGG